MTSGPRGRRAASLPPLLFLIGYRGTGKTTVAPLLADRLQWSWTDADRELEARAGRGIAAIISAEGEAAFRRREAEILADFCRDLQQVVATGGGVVLAPENRRLLRARGKVVWLTADAATIWDRLRADPMTALSRPALLGGGLAEVETALRAREPLYRECADATVSTMGRTPAEVASIILAELPSDEGNALAP